MIRERRNIELSTLYYIETQVADNWTDVNVVKSFAQVVQTDVPVICIELESTDHITREVGSYEKNHDHLIIINIFASSSAQRLDLVDFIFDQIKTGYTYYEHSYATDKSYIKTENGRVRLVDIVSDTKIPILSTTNKKERFRHELSFIVSRY